MMWPPPDGIDVPWWVCEDINRHPKLTPDRHPILVLTHIWCNHRCDAATSCEGLQEEGGDVAPFA